MLRILQVLYGICESRLYHDFKGIDARLREKEVIGNAAQEGDINDKTIFNGPRK